MALSNAERQRRWRQKQREDNYQNYLKKERKRKKDKYVHTHLLSQEKKEMSRRVQETLHQKEKENYGV